MKQPVKFIVFFSVVGCLAGVSVLGDNLLHAHYAKVRAAQVTAFTKATATVTPISHVTFANVPTRISIPALHTNASIAVVGVDSSGRMATIPSPSTVAWYAYGAMPGEPGNAIFAGHRDWNGVLGTFWRLEDLKIGDVVVFTFSDQTQLTFRVTANHTYPENAVPPTVMNIDGPSRTTLITCAGDFDRSQGGYQSRVVVNLEEVR